MAGRVVYYKMKNATMFNRFIAQILLLILSPFLIICYFFVKLTSKGPFLFKQLRMGKDKKPFWMYKIRTMVENAQELKAKYQKLNETDGPVFKIYHDPRYTSFGKWLSHTGLDELPQLVNIVKGEMAFVGPRPLPIDEAKQIPTKYALRFTVLPGITSSWVVKGSHKLTFDEWMRKDINDVNKKSFFYNLKIAGETISLIITLILRRIVHY
jgi:lipopolysaccharide/colanic/teichoic acid biosynthesis glycosyltransferase